MPGVRGVDWPMKLHRDRANILNDGEFYDYNLLDGHGRKELKLSSTVRVLSPSSSTGSSFASCSPNGSIIVLGLGGCNYIQHYVSKMDTLAGIAIMYGVEEKHPPSPTLSRSFDDQCNVDRSELQVQVSRRPSDLVTSFQSFPDNRKVSPAMSNLQNFYGLNSTTEAKDAAERMHKKEGDNNSQYLELDTPSLNPPSCSNSHLSHSKRSKSIDYNLSENGNGKSSSDDKEVTAEHFGSYIPEKSLKEKCRVIAGTGLALRSKAASRNMNMIASGVEPLSDGSGRTNPIPGPIRSGNSCGTAADNGCIEVRKCCSLSSIHDQDYSSSSSSIWLTSKWRLKKSDIQALSTASISKPIFDGFPKPVVGRRNKAALD